jgi:hypothetical protein
MFVNYRRRWQFGVDSSGLTHYTRNDRAACDGSIRTTGRSENEVLHCPFCFTHIDLEPLAAGTKVTSPRGTGKVGYSDEVYCEVYTHHDEYYVSEIWRLTLV